MVGDGDGDGDGTERIAFCCTNIDLHALAAYDALRRLGIPTDVWHCLGACHACLEGPVAMANGRISAADDCETLLKGLRARYAPRLSSLRPKTTGPRELIR